MEISDLKSLILFPSKALARIRPECVGGTHMERRAILRRCHAVAVGNGCQDRLGVLNGDSSIALASDCRTCSIKRLAVDETDDQRTSDAEKSMEKMYGFMALRRGRRN